MFNKKNTINSIILYILFYLNIKNKLSYNFNIFINKFNFKNKFILNYIKNIKDNVMFNFRNKLNFNKSKRNLVLNKKKTGKSRLGSSSSNILRKGLIWYGLRNIKLKKKINYINLINYILFKKKHIINVVNLEIIQFLKELTSNNINLYETMVNLYFKKYTFINLIKYPSLIKQKIINIAY